MTDMQHAVAEMLRPHAHNVRSPMAGIEQTGERQACERPYLVMVCRVVTLLPIHRGQKKAPGVLGALRDRQENV